MNYFIKRNKDFGKFIGEFNDYIELKLEDVDYKVIDDILNDMPEDRTYSWQSKYNHYIEYDTEPFVTQGFYIKTLIRFTDHNRCLYYEYLFNKKLKQISDLEKLYSQDIDLYSDEGKKIKELQEA